MRDNLHRVKYGWVLEAAPFIGCMAPNVDETNLQLLLGSEDQQLGVDIALNTINDKGVTADTDQLRELALDNVVLTRREQELADECTSWRVKNAETRARLTKARVVSCIHPYLNHSTLILDHYRPETMRTVSRRPAHPMYPRLTHKRWASYGHAQGLSDWRLVI